MHFPKAKTRLWKVKNGNIVGKISTFLTIRDKQFSQYGILLNMKNNWREENMTMEYIMVFGSFVPVIASTVLILMSVVAKKLKKYFKFFNLALVFATVLYSWLTLSQFDLTRSMRTLSENLMIVEFYILFVILIISVLVRLIEYVKCKREKISCDTISIGSLIGLFVIVVLLRVWVIFLAIDAGDFFNIV